MFLKEVTPLVLFKIYTRFKNSTNESYLIFHRSKLGIRDVMGHFLGNNTRSPGLMTTDKSVSIDRFILH